MIAVQAALAAAALIVSFAFPGVGDAFFTKVEDRFRAIANRKGLSIALVALLALIARVATLPVEPVPRPHVDDEFGYLLSADTFSHGRLTNPTPAMWQHFETIHEIMQPTYNSQYPPGQAVALAIGQLLGSPFIGVLLSMAAMCATICWMLQGWFSPPWALLGGLISVPQFGVFSYWADSYWGGAVPALGGALLLGSLPRIQRDCKISDAVIMGLGLAVLGSTRPFEGLIFGIPVVTALIVGLFKTKRCCLTLVLSRVATPLLVVLCASAAATGYYCWRVTGSPFKLPYQVNRASNLYSPYFIWQTRQEPAGFPNEAFRDLYDTIEVKAYEQTRTLPGLFRTWGSRISEYFWFYLGPILICPLLVAMAATPYGTRWSDLRKETRVLVMVLSVFACGLATEVYYHSHYASPATSATVALIISALVFIRRWNPRKTGAGRALTRAIPCASMLAVLLYPLLLHVPKIRAIDSGKAEFPWLLSPGPRDRIEAQLKSGAANNLVIVNYSANSPTGWSGWVENGADIDSSKIVWAWDKGTEKNRELLSYYKDRRAWLVNSQDGLVTPYPLESSVVSVR